MNTLGKSVLLLPLLLIVTCPSVRAQAKPDSQVVITIKRQTSLGCSPDYSAEIYADGTVVYHGVACVKVVGGRQHKITPDRVTQLIKAFEEANYFSFKDAMRLTKPVTDLARTTTSISLNGKYKMVVDYLCPPKELIALEDLIDRLAGLYEYIGPL